MRASIEWIQAAPERRGGPAQAATSGSGTRVDPLEVAACRAAVLDECGRGGRDVTELAVRLQGLGFPPLSPTWALVWSDDPDQALSAALEESDLDRLELLERLALASPGPAVRRLLEARIVSEASLAELNWILAYLAEHGAWREVDLLLALSAVDVTWLGADPGRVRADVVAGLRAMLARDAKSYSALRSCALASAEDYGSVAIEALEGMTGDRALATLAYLLDERSFDAGALVRAIEQVGRRSLPPFDDFLMRRLRELAGDGDVDTELRAAALRAAGALGDEDSLSLQIDGLGDEQGEVRSASDAALTELTGLRFGASQTRWTSWHAGESSWWDERAPLVLERLEDDDPAVAIAALSELVPHRMQRGRLARAIARRLDDESPQLRHLACLALEQLGSRTVALDVLERLSDVDDDVRDSAHRCLQTLFRVELPPEREPWIDHFEQSDLALR